LQLLFSLNYDIYYSQALKGCILKKSEYFFTSGSYEEDKKIQDNKEKKEEIDFAALARSN